MHRIFKSDLKLSKASTRWVLLLVSVDDCEHNPASYNCENCPTSFRILMTCAGGSDLLLVKLVHKLYYSIFFLQNLHDNAEIMEEFTCKI